MKRLLLALAVVGATLSNAAAEWEPTKPVEMVVGSGAGGVVDMLARMLTEMWTQHKVVPQPFTVSNRSGAGFSAAVGHLQAHPGDPHYLSLVGPSWISTAVQTRRPQSFDVTVIARMFDTPIILAVRTDSAFKTVNDLADALKKDPASASFGISTAAGNIYHLGVLRFAELAGADPTKVRVVVNDSGMKGVTQMLGGHLDVALTSAGQVQSLTKDGSVRILGVLTTERLVSHPDIPTLKEEGFDVQTPGLLTLVAPQGITPEQADYWLRVTRETLEKDEVKKFVADQGLILDFVETEASIKQIEEERANLTQKMTELGILQ